MNSEQNMRERLTFELMLIVVVTGMAYLLYCMGAYKIVVLNLFFLPVVLAGYFLGRTNSGVLALFSVLVVTIAVTVDLESFVIHSRPLIVVLVLSIWGASLGLTAILLGTLCDERARTLKDLHTAYVGVVEVVAKYLQSANQKVKARATRVAELSQEVALQLRMTQREIDDIRVAALLHDLGNVEITTRLLTRAVDALEANPDVAERNTFSGLDLVHSLGAVLSSAMPLLAAQDGTAKQVLDYDTTVGATSVPLGGRIIHAVREYDALVHGSAGNKRWSPAEALQIMRKDISAAHDETVLAAIEQVIPRRATENAREPVLAR
jgi:K+-sensing histidine kinase KdpD